MQAHYIRSFYNNNNNGSLIVFKFKQTYFAALYCFFSFNQQIHAASFEFDNFTVDWDTSISAGAQMRIEKRNQDIALGAKGREIVGTYRIPGQTQDLPLYDLDNLQKVLDNAFIINSNDGNNSFDQGDFTSLRVSMLSEADINFGSLGPIEGFGVFVRGKLWQDSAYAGSTGIEAGSQAWAEYNANPILGPNGGYNAKPGEFSGGARGYSKQGTKLLDFFAYGYLPFFNDNEISFRIGRQVISWGEALLSGGGISQGINYVDSDIINQPGFDLKELFQPTGAVFAQVPINESINLEAYMQYEWNPVIISPSGSFNNEFDSIGAGGNTFMFLSGTEDRILGVNLDTSVNPDAESVLQFLPSSCGPNDDRDARCRLLVPYHLRTNEPGNTGQYGFALNFFLDNGDEMGLYFVNYHAKIPSFILPIDAIETFAPVIDILLYLTDPEKYDETLKPQGGFVGIEDFSWKLSEKQLTALLGFLGTIPPEDGSVKDIIAGIANNPDSLKDLVPDSFVEIINLCKDSLGPVCSAAIGALGGAGANLFLDQFGFNSDTVIRSINYRLEYADNIQLGGFTYSTVFGSANVATEVSYRANVPLLGGDVPRTPKRWELWNWHLNTLMVFEPSLFWDFSSFSAEAMAWYVPGALEYDPTDLTNKKRLAVQNTPYGLGLSMFWSWEYQSVFPGWDIIVPWYATYGVLGASFNSGYRNGQGTFASGATFRNSTGFEAGIGFKFNFGEQDDQFQMMVQDRDVVNFTMKYSF